MLGTPVDLKLSSERLICLLYFLFLPFFFFFFFFFSPQEPFLFTSLSLKVLVSDTRHAGITVAW